MTSFKLTVQKFFVQDGSIDSYAFLLGLVLLLTFAFMRLPLGLSQLACALLASNVFRYITTDALFHEEFLRLEGWQEVLAYALAKNSFTLLFEAGVLALVFLLVNVLKIFSFEPESTLAMGQILGHLFLVLETENLILLVNHRSVPSYQKGIRRDGAKDIAVGLVNAKSMFPSIVANGMIAALLFYYVQEDFPITVAGLYYLLCLLIFVRLRTKF
ncbi:hypothetical protein [Aerococcus sp. UMB7834]|uniref:hypothetical protein n=1 Tax=Aerococcus sp. UMB7834 TaxID=3046342 RepID=UPI00255156CF|nr:hypothetical protein [Aerococcus sp. UMB7834]MDK6805413.1 hypothetical protein [Aerococcus sp. UMB7834]